MKTYAKLINETTLDVFKGLTNMVYQDPALVKERATSDGYKLVVYHTRSHHLTEVRYRETPKEIQAEWHDLPIETAREQQRASIVTSCNRAYAEAMGIYSTAEVLVAQDSSEQAITAMAEARGISIEQQAEELSMSIAMGKVINGCLAGYSLRLEDAIKAASTVTEIAGISWSREDFTSIVEDAMAQLQEGGASGNS